MSSSGESASPGVSFSPGFLGAILLPGLGGCTKGLCAFLGSALAAAAFALSFSSLALAASCVLVSFSTLAPFLWESALCASALAAAFATGLTDLTSLTGFAG